MRLEIVSDKEQHEEITYKNRNAPKRSTALLKTRGQRQMPKGLVESLFCYFASVFMFSPPSYGILSPSELRLTD